jgi:hypothetical protein
MAKGYNKILGLLPLLSIVIGILIGISTGHGGHGTAPGVLAALVVTIILALLPDKAKKSEP